MWSRGGGVSKASGGRTSPHFATASGSDTGENSEICAGARRRVCSSCVSGTSCGTTRNGEADVTAHQARTPLRPASDTAATRAFLNVVFVLGQRHCIRGVVGNSPASLQRKLTFL